MANFEDEREVEAWARKRSRDELIVVSSRVALRTLPCLRIGLAEAPRAARDRALAQSVLPIFRAMAAGWVAASFPSQSVNAEFLSAAGRASVGASLAAARPLSFAASRAASVAASAAAAACRPPDAIFQSRDHASQAAVRGVEVFSDVSADTFPSVDYGLGAGRLAQQFRNLRSSAVAAAASDAEALDRMSAEDLGGRPLWGDIGTPQAAAEVWAYLKRILLSAADNWRVWTDWYDDRLDGQPPQFEAVELARVMLGDEFWERGPEKVNRELLRILEEERAKQAHGDQQDPPPSSSTDAPPAIPPLQPAAVEPLWVEQQLILPRRALPSDIDPQTLQAALRSLRRSLSVLAEDAENDTNVDRRAVRMLRRLAEAIPDDVPPQDVLFDLGHGLARLRDYQGSVHEQWPDILAADYNAAVLQYDRTVRQFPRWREFIRNADRDRLTAEQVRSVRETAETLGAILDSEGVDVVVDPGIGRALARLASLLPSAADIEHTNEVIDAAIQEIALDLLESLDNVLKRLAERTVDGYSAIAAFNSALVPLLKQIWDSPTVVDARNNFDSAFKAQLSKAAKAAGNEAAEAVFYVPVCLLMFGVASALGVTGIGAAALTLAPVASRFKWCRDLMSWMKKSLGG